MMDKEYLIILKEVTSNDDYQKLKNEKHHGISRYEHLVRVAKRTFIITKKRNLNYKEATRGALLHDFFYSSEVNTHTLRGVYRHPILAYKRSKEMYKLTDKESNVIKAHMFPLAKEFPKSKEAWIVLLVDKGVGLKEFVKYKFITRKLFN